MLPLLEDLRKYITRIDLCKESTGWYFKNILERCDKDFAQEIVNNIRDNRDYIIDNEIDVFSFLIKDYHVGDFIGNMENIVINAILKALSIDYIIDVINDPIYELVYHTERGKKLGFDDGSALMRKIYSEEWPGFEEYLEDYSDEEIIRMVKNEETYIDDLEYASMIIVLDELNDNYYDAAVILEEIGFAEISPGLMFYGCIGSMGYDEIDISLEPYQLECILDILSLYPKHIELGRYDEVFEILNISGEGYGMYTICDMLEDIRSSRMEVMF